MFWKNGIQPCVDVNGINAIGSGNMFASCATQALLDIEDLSAKEVAIRSMAVAAD